MWRLQELLMPLYGALWGNGGFSGNNEYSRLEMPATNRNHLQVLVLVPISIYDAVQNLLT